MTKTPNYVFDTNDELCHWGIIGQKWGRRRFQNEDGSLTAEGRERYGVSEARSKSDAQKAKARISYNTQKYKADLKSKAKREADTRTAKEERSRLKEQAKTEKVLKREQAKIDRIAKKEKAKTEKQNRPLGMKMTRTKNMSDEELQKAVDRLKLQAEYSKAYAIAANPNSALAKADRFFDGPTGKVAAQIATATIPMIANTVVSKAVESKLKYANKEDRDKIAAEIDKTKANAEKLRAERDKATAEAENKRASTTNDYRKTLSELEDAKLNRKISVSNQLASLKERESAMNRANAESAAKIKLDRSKQAVESYASANETRAKSRMAELDRKIKEAENFGYDWKPDAWKVHVNGSIQNKQNSQQTAMNTIRSMAASGEISPTEALDLMKKYGLLVK